MLTRVDTKPTLVHEVRSKQAQNRHVGTRDVHQRNAVLLLESVLPCTQVLCM